MKRWSRPRSPICAWLWAAIGALTWASAAAQATGSTDFAQLRAAHRTSDVAMLSRHGEVLATVRVQPQVRVGPWVALEDISPALRQALLASEDKRFWQHAGVDWATLAASAWANALNTRTRGASTVTMQLAGLLDDALARPRQGRSPAGKLAQIQRARELEAHWSKAHILEAYLNLVPLRGELVGVQAGAQQLFGKYASGLNALEAAMLAVLVRAPNAPERAVVARACQLLRQLQTDAAAAAAAADPCSGLATTVAQALARKPSGMLGPSLAPHLARKMAREATVAREATGWPTALHSTLDARVQRLALAALKRQLAELRGREADDGAVVVLDNASGQVLAWVGSIGAASAAGEVDAVTARRQPGSTIKPFVYALALEQKRITAASLIDDSPLQVSAGQALYLPRNYDHQYRGAVSARTALASSLNIPAVRVAALLDGEALFERLNAAGLRLAHNANYHGAALALGTADVTLLDLTNAYRMLAQGGRTSAPQWWREAKAPAPQTPVFSPEAAWLVGHILADPAARASGFGLDSPLVTRGFAAAKTGTSKDMRDNWCIGFTSRYTVGVWVGNAGGQPMHHVSGVTGAAPAWREIVQALHESEASRAPLPPASLTQLGGEFFLPGTQMHARTPTSTPAGAGAASSFGINTPREGTVMVLDPDIPAAQQQVVFSGAMGQWWIDDRPLGQGARFHWPAKPGVHVLRWRDAVASESIQFDVRAAPPQTVQSVQTAKTRAQSSARTNAASPHQ